MPFVRSIRLYLIIEDSILELRHLRYFVTLAEELHFARAAERLNIAPPTLTVQIQEIERSLSARLFVRTKRSVALTYAGTIFLAEAQKVLTQYQQAESIGRRAGRGEVGRVELGYVASAAYAGVLQEQVTKFTSTWEEVDLVARELAMDALPQNVAEGSVDIGFVRLPLTIPSELRIHVLLRDVFCLAVPSNIQSPVTGIDLAQASFIAPEQEAGTFELARRGSFTPNIVSTPGSLLAVLAQVSIGAGIAVVPSAVRNVVHLPGVSFQAIGGEPIVSEVAAVFRSNETSPAVLNMIRQIQATSAKILAPHEFS